MKAFLIDPFEKQITEVDYSGDFHQIYDFIGCGLFTVARCQGFDVFVDDEGLFVDQQQFFLAEGFPQPLGGKGLVLGVDDEGNSITPDITLEELEARIMWVEGVVWEDE